MKLVGPRRQDGNVKPYAVIEMGGASAQVSQIATSDAERKQIKPAHLFEFEIDGEKYTLFTHSYLGYGAEQARDILNAHIMESHRKNGVSGPVEDPCLNDGFKVEAGKGGGVDVYYGRRSQKEHLGMSKDGRQCAKELQTALFTMDRSKCSISATANKEPEFVRKAEPMTFGNFIIRPAASASRLKQPRWYR